MPRRILLAGPSLDDLIGTIRREHPPGATIVGAERVTVGGIRGFFARHHYELTVEVPDPDPRGSHTRLDLPSRIGIAALLDEAESLDTGPIDHRPPTPQLSTSSSDFARLLDDLSLATADPSGAPPARRRSRTIPGLLSGNGDLVAIVGLMGDPLAVASSMVSTVGTARTAIGGKIASEGDRIDTRAQAIEARARGVASGFATYLAFGLGRGEHVESSVQDLLKVGADEVWLAVDPGRKVDDTARWTHAVMSAMPVDALAVEGRCGTSTPETVTALGRPIGWIDGMPASRTTPITPLG